MWQQSARNVVHLHAVPNALAIETARRLAPTVCTVHDMTVTCLNSIRLLRSSKEVCLDAVGWKCGVRVFTERCAARRPDRFVRNWIVTSRYMSALRRLPAVIAPAEFMRQLLIRTGCSQGAVRTIHNFFVLPTRCLSRRNPGSFSLRAGSTGSRVQIFS